MNELVQGIFFPASTHRHIHTLMFLVKIPICYADIFIKNNANIVLGHNDSKRVFAADFIIIT